MLCTGENVENQRLGEERRLGEKAENLDS